MKEKLSSRMCDGEKGEPVYMLSKLLTDLDDLCGEQEPYIEAKLEEVFEILSTSIPEVLSEEPEKEPDVSFEFFHRGDFSWTTQKKEAVEVEAIDEESEESLELNLDNDIVYDVI